MISIFKKSLLFNIFQYLPKSLYRRFFFTIGFIVLCSISEGISIFMLSITMERFSSSQSALNSQFLINLDQDLVALTTIILILSTSFFRAVSLRLNIKLSSNVSYYLFLKCYKNLLTLPYLDFKLLNSSLILTKLSYIELFITKVFMPILQTLSGVLLSLGCTIVLLYLFPNVVLTFAIVLSLFYLILYSLLKTKLSNVSDIVDSSRKKLMGIYKSTFDAIRDIHLDQIAPLYIKSSSENAKKFISETVELEFITASPRYLVEALLLSGILIIFFFTRGPLSISSGITQIATLGYALQRIIPLLQQTYASISCYKGYRYCLEGILGLLKKRNKKGERVLNKLKSLNSDLNKKNSYRKLHQISGLLLKDISFKYESSSNFIFKNLDYFFKKGTWTAIQGSSGSGKSTLIDIICGLIETSEGDLFIKSNKLVSIKKFKSYKRLISQVSQKSFFINSSIINNITLHSNKSNIDLDYIDRLIEIFQMKECISYFNEGLNYKVGEFGSNLSGGQLQRLALIRAMYKKPQILILDESFSAIDLKTTLEIQKSIKINFPNLIVVLTSHRKQDLEICDSFIKLSSSSERVKVIYD